MSHRCSLPVAFRGEPRQVAERRADKGSDWLRPPSGDNLDAGLPEPEVMVGAVAYLDSPGASWVSGQVIDVAAGANAWTA